MKKEATTCSNIKKGKLLDVKKLTQICNTVEQEKNKFVKGIALSGIKIIKDSNINPEGYEIHVGKKLWLKIAKIKFEEYTKRVKNKEVKSESKKSFGTC